MTTGDTVRFTGITSPTPWLSAARAKVPHPPGALRLWLGAGGALEYAESSAGDIVRRTWIGNVGLGSRALPRSFDARFVVNDTTRASETVTMSGDSVVATRDGQRTAELLDQAAVRLPALRPSPVFVALAQCALSRPDRELPSRQLGAIRIRELATTVVRSGRRSRNVALYLLTSDSIPEIAALWLERESHQLFAMRGADGMDFVLSGWEASLEQLTSEEVRASRAKAKPQTCAGGVGPGSCAPTRWVCPETVPGRVRGSAVVSDSGYTVTSDGTGPYANGSGNVIVVTGPVAAILLQGTTNGPRRPKRPIGDHQGPGTMCGNDHFAWNGG